MSACAVLSATPVPSQRKRTTSFSFNPTDKDYYRPAKAPRMGSSSLRRSESILLLPTPAVDAVPYNRTLSYYKEQRQRRRMGSKPTPSEHLTIRTTPLLTKNVAPCPVVSPPTPPPKAAPPPRPLVAPSKVICPSPSKPVTTYLTPRRTSPLSPQQFILPGRPVFPRSKQPPNLLRTAIKMRMLTTEEGKRILSLGPRLAMEIAQTSQDILRVTRELEIMVDEVDEDVVMEDGTSESVDAPATEPTLAPPSSPIEPTPSIALPPTPRPSALPLPPLQPLLASYTPPLAAPSTPHDPSPAPPVLTTSWVVVKGNEDWEMVDCAA